MTDNRMVAAALREAAQDQALITALHVHLEDVLIEFRDLRLSELGCVNGLVVREQDGRRSDIIRIGTRDAITMTLRALADQLEAV